MSFSFNLDDDVLFLVLIGCSFNIKVAVCFKNCSRKVLRNSEYALINTNSFSSIKENIGWLAALVLLGQFLDIDSSCHIVINLEPPIMQVFILSNF